MELLISGTIVLAAQILATVLWSSFRGLPTLLLWGAAWGLGCLTYLVHEAVQPPFSFLLYAGFVGCLAAMQRWHDRCAPRPVK